MKIKSLRKLGKITKIGAKQKPLIKGGNSNIIIDDVIGS